jgi:hypothetical protein
VAEQMDSGVAGIIGVTLAQPDAVIHAAQEHDLPFVMVDPVDTQDTRIVSIGSHQLGGRTQRDRAPPRTGPPPHRLDRWPARLGSSPREVPRVPRGSRLRRTRPGSDAGAQRLVLRRDRAHPRAGVTGARGTAHRRRRGGRRDRGGCPDRGAGAGRPGTGATERGRFRRHASGRVEHSPVDVGPPAAPGNGPDGGRDRAGHGERSPASVPPLELATTLSVRDSTAPAPTGT